VFVTYLYWDDRFDEWIPNVEERLAPLHTHTYTHGGRLDVGQRVEVLDETSKWLEAFVIAEEEHQVGNLRCRCALAIYLHFAIMHR
jgi:hypothetical protein